MLNHKLVIEKKPDGTIIYHCTVCNGIESSLPTDCPGIRMTERELDLVHDNRMDYIGNRWIRKW